MSIRYKQIIIMFFLFVINLSILLGYYELNLSNEMNRILRMSQEKLETAAKEVADILEEADDLIAAMGIIDNGTNYMFSVYDFDGKLLYESSDIEDYTFYNVRYFENNGSLYRLKIASLEEIQNPLAMTVPRKLAWFEMISLCLTFVIYSFIIHIIQIKPLQNLARDMEEFRYGQTVKTTKKNDEIGKCRNNFAELTRRLEREKQVQNQIIASVSHDIKTPLTSVMGYTERLQKKQFSPERTRKYLDTIYQRSNDIKELVEEFDDYLGCNMINTLKLQIISLNDLKKGIILEYGDELESRDVKFNVDLKCDGNILVGFDVTRMRRVFGNIIGNSLKFFDKDTKEINISIYKENRHIIFDIADNGSGVKEEELENIFAPLYTSDESRSVAGLGLAICKQLVEAHNGTIKAKNVPSGGLLIEISFPEYVPN